MCMRRKTCYVFLTDEYADWEIALVTAGLHSFGNVEVITFSLDKEPVCSMGNLAVLADLSLEEVDTPDVDLLVLPGGPLWEGGHNDSLGLLIEDVLRAGKGVAAIGEATGFLASELDDEQLYMHPDEALSQGRIIVAGSACPFPFARHIFEYYGLDADPHFQQWARYFEREEFVS